MASCSTSAVSCSKGAGTPCSARQRAGEADVLGADPKRRHDRRLRLQHQRRLGAKQRRVRHAVALGHHLAEGLEIRARLGEDRERLADRDRLDQPEAVLHDLDAARLAGPADEALAAADHVEDRQQARAAAASSPERIRNSSPPAAWAGAPSIGHSR